MPLMPSFVKVDQPVETLDLVLFELTGQHLRLLDIHCLQTAGVLEVHFAFIRIVLAFVVEGPGTFFGLP